MNLAATRTLALSIRRFATKTPLSTPGKRKRSDEFRSCCPSIPLLVASSYLLEGRIYQSNRLTWYSTSRILSSLVQPESPSEEVVASVAAAPAPHTVAETDWKREKERERQRRRRAKRKERGVLNRHQPQSTAVTLVDDSPVNGKVTKARQANVDADRRRIEWDTPSIGANKASSFKNGRNPLTISDPAVSAILDDLKRLTMQISSNDSVTVTAESSEQSFLPPLPSPAAGDRLSVNRPRRVVSQFIPMWLRREPTWKVAVLEHLNLPTHLSESITTSTRGGGSTTAGILGAASILPINFYPDSIPSFAEILKQGPPESLNRALDGLVEAGLADAGTAERYRTTNRMRVQQQDLVAAIADKKVSIERHQRLHDQMSEELIDINARIETLTSQSAGLRVDNAVAASRLDGDPALDNLPVEASASVNESFQKQLANLIKMKGEKTRNMSRHRYNVDTLNTKLKLLQTEQPERPLTEEEYARIQHAATAAMTDITRVFANHVRDRNSQLLEQYQALENKTDLTRPAGWFLHARLDQRKVIFHGGGTNSGKTYAALERLKQAKKGMYLGPLRLLAVEIYEKLTADGIYCNLYTGQERREIPFATHGAATVEMAGLMEEYDVIVIDEIQMLSDWERGFAWTRALLGSRCKEIHVCGGMEASKIVKRIADACGDEFELRTYQRFSELQIANDSLADIPDHLGSYKNVRPGDCVVAFSRNDIFAIKREIESTTNYKCCVIYGTLPPATRSEQARRFNDPNSGYDVLVASDAIGMGLNLSIRRIIFNSVYKNDGTGIVRLDHSAMKQISGRAGRRNSPFPEGEVTTRDPRDMEYLRQCLVTDVQPIEKAGLLPTTAHIQTFSDTLEQYGLGHGSKNLHSVLLQFNDMASVKSDYFVCKQGAMVKIARVIARLDLSIADKYLLCQCPVSERDSSSMDVLKRFATKLAAKEVAGLTRSMIPKAPKSFDDLARLCSLFSELELFMWLNTKFPHTKNVMEQQTAQSLKEQAIKMITQGLSVTDKLKLNHCYVTRDRSLRQKWISSQSKQGDRFDEDEDEDWNDGVADV